MTKVSEEMDIIVESNPLLKMGWAKYPIINYCMVQEWISELMVVGGQVANPQGLLDPEVVQRLVELSYLCGVPVPGTYRDRTGKIHNDDLTSLNQGLQKYKTKRDSS